MKTKRQKIAGDECYTPADHMGLVRLVLRQIGLDPASCALANRVVRALRFFTKKQNGLARRWRARTLFMNCPYSNPKAWVIKLLASYNAGDVAEAIALFNSRTGSQWFDLMASQAWRCELRKRIRFYGPSTRNGEGNGMQDNVYFYLGDNPERFAAVFGEVGRIIRDGRRDLLRYVHALSRRPARRRDDVLGAVSQTQVTHAGCGVSEQLELFAPARCSTCPRELVEHIEHYRRLCCMCINRLGMAGHVWNEDPDPKREHLRRWLGGEH
jgi:hypothetical protein